ncbi:MAG: OmpA family protein [Vicingaceae bacterium]
MKLPLAIAILFISMFAACVPAKKVEDIKRKKEICEEQRAALEEANPKLDEDFTEVNEKYQDLLKTQKVLTRDSIVNGRSMRLISKNYDQLNETYELLLSKNKELLEGREAESASMFRNLTQSQQNLRDQTMALQESKGNLEEAKRNLEAKERNLAILKTELEKREERVNELEAVLARKDSAVLALKAKVQDALLGFENNGLTIEQKNGKVYVSLDESLLFASGKYDIEKKGKEALNSLGAVLEKNSDVNVLVEGHTDNVPYNGSGILKDNWDLSVKRATSVVKIILEKNDINAQRLTAAGRADYIPIASNDTKEGRAANRRTEIILTPKLDELMKLLESN